MYTGVLFNTNAIRLGFYLQISCKLQQGITVVNK